MRMVQNRLLLVLVGSLIALPFSALVLLGVATTVGVQVPWWLVGAVVLVNGVELALMVVGAALPRRPRSTVTLDVRRVRL